jgi:hypothetical protein
VSIRPKKKQDRAVVIFGSKYRAPLLLVLKLKHGLILHLLRHAALGSGLRKGLGTL